MSAPLTEQVPHLRAESVRVPENRDDTSRGAGCPPTHPPPNEIGAGTHKTIPARAPRIFIESRTARPVPCTSRAIMCRGPGVQPPGSVPSTHQSDIHILAPRTYRFPKTRADTTRGARCPPTHPRRIRLGAGTHKTFQHDHPEFFIKSRTARPVPRTSRAIMRRGPGVRTPGAGRGGTREPGKRWFAPSRE